MPQIAPSLSIGQVAERTGLSVHTLRFYERQGLLANAVRRRPNGRRVYSEDDVEWLTTCTMLRASGMPLTTIRRYVDLVRQGAGNEEDRLAVLREHQEQLTRQSRIPGASATAVCPADASRGGASAQGGAHRGPAPTGQTLPATGTSHSTSSSPP